MIAHGRPRTREPLFDAADAARALDAAQRIFEAALPRLPHEDVPPESMGRYGAAVLVAEALARAGRAGEEALRAPLREALVFAPDRLSLYDGAAGLLLALDAVDPRRESLRQVRARLRDALVASLRAAGPPDLGTPKSYDLISGAAGRAVALGADEPAVQSSVRAFARAFAAEVERCMVSDDSNVAASVNLGVAHGVPGVLAALNAALPHDRETARRLVDVLLASAREVGGALRWGAVCRRNEVPSARRAWCYQTVGVAGVLADRARIDGDAGLHQLAATALRGVLDEPDDQPYDAALCHGRSGVATIAWRFADDEGIARHARRLAGEVLAEFDPSAPLGYRTFDSRDGRIADRVCFLDGSLGIAQFLIDAATAQERRWLPLFGLLPD